MGSLFKPCASCLALFSGLLPLFEAVLSSYPASNRALIVRHDGVGPTGGSSPSQSGLGVSLAHPFSLLALPQPCLSASASRPTAIACLHQPLPPTRTR